MAESDNLTSFDSAQKWWEGRPSFTAATKPNCIDGHDLQRKGDRMICRRCEAHS